MAALNYQLRNSFVDRVDQKFLDSATESVAAFHNRLEWYIHKFYLDEVIRVIAWRMFLSVTPYHLGGL